MTLIADMLTNRIREIRKRRRVTLDRLSELTGLSVSHLSRLESGKRNLNTNSLVSIADALQVKPSELIDAAAAWLEVDVSGALSENQEIATLDPTEPKQVNVPAAFGLVKALLVRGTFLYPRYAAGDVLTYLPEAKEISHIIGRECVVRLPDGRTLLRTVERGAAENCYILTSFNLPPMHNVAILWAKPIEYVIRGK